MSTNDERPPQKLLIAAMAASVFAIVGTAGVLFYLGMFSTPVLKQTTMPSHRLAYISHTGPYNLIKNKIKQVQMSLNEAGITPIAAAAIFFDDPSQVPENELRSHVGYLVERRDYLPGNVQETTIEPQEVVQATFDGSPMLGSYKSYSAMKDWAQHNGYTLNLPALEIYYDNGVVEYYLPITKK